MKTAYLILAMMLFVCSALIPEAVWSQSELLPEKSNKVTVENTDALPLTVSSSSQQADSGDNSWFATVFAILLASLFFVFLEIAVIPGFGVCGILGGVFLVVGLLLAYIKLTVGMAVTATVVAVIGVVFLFVFAIWILPHTSLGKNFILKEEAPKPEDLSAVSDYTRFVGAEGEAISNLRPSGIAKVAGERLDVITEGDFVEKGMKIKVIKATAGKIIVAPMEE